MREKIKENASTVSRLTLVQDDLMGPMRQSLRKEATKSKPNTSKSFNKKNIIESSDDDEDEEVDVDVNEDAYVNGDANLNEYSNGDDERIMRGSLIVNGTQNNSISHAQDNQELNCNQPNVVEAEIKRMDEQLKALTAKFEGTIVVNKAFVIFFLTATL